jgi:hypothetical protein
MKKIIALSAAALLSTNMYASTSSEMQAQIDMLKAQIAKIEKQQAKILELETKNEAQALKIETLETKQAKTAKMQKRLGKKVSKVNAMAANDNVKFDVEFRNTYETLDYKVNGGAGYDANYNTSEKFKNDGLLTSRFYLNMSASPMKGLIFKGQLGIYSTWGAHLFDESTSAKSWSGSSKADDTIMRIKEAYFVYSDEMGEQPYSLSIGRRPASNGFLANYRENEDKPGSPLAHITNMEVDAAMVKFDWSRFVEGAYSKFVYGRAHSGEMEGLYGNAAQRFPYAEIDDSSEDDNVDFFVTVGDAYNDGQYQLMYQWAHIFNTKGLNLAQANTYQAWIDGGKVGTEPHTGKKNGAGEADLFALSFKVDGIGEEINDFLDSTTAFASVAYTNYSADDGYSLIGSDDGGSKSGQSIWLGAVFPDMITENGKFGIEYNHGSRYWTPMTWAEDTAMGSKIAVRGDAYEAYWNFDLFGVKYLPSQVRYTYMQHDYTPNINCAGWVTPNPVDITAQSLRFAVTYKY